jgi:hypothetical protein
LQKHCNRTRFLLLSCIQITKHHAVWPEDLLGLGNFDASIY